MRLQAQAVTTLVRPVAKMIVMAHATMVARALVRVVALVVLKGNLLCCIPFEKRRVWHFLLN